jgi:TonB family protein
LTLYGVYLAPRGSASTAEAVGPSREAAIDRITLAGGGNTVVLQTGSLGEALGAMRTCAADLVAELETTGRLAKGAVPKGNPGDWITPSDYPAVSVRKEEEGVVRFRLMVDATGNPTACHVTDSTESEAFEDVVCLALLQRAKFEPALDGHGKPAASYWSNTARFQVPH